MSCSCLPCQGSGGQLGRPGRLEEPWRRLLPNGEIFAALVLSTLFSEKYKGRNMSPGETAEIRLPSPPGAEPKVWRPTLLHRTGSKEVCVFIWRGDDSSGFPTIFFAFSPLRKRMQFFKIWMEGQVSPDKETIEVLSEDGQPTGDAHELRMLPYVQKKMRNLWQKYGFQALLEDVLARYPDHLLLCCGLSHGAALAQAAVLRMSLAYPHRSFQAVTWNSYKFLDEEGAELMRSAVGKRLLPFVLSRRGYWDSIAGAPHDLAPVSHIVFLDADTGDCRPAKDVGRTRLGVRSVWLAYKLHFAKVALKATRLATASALLATDPANGHAGLKAKKTLTWPVRGNTRAWSYATRDPLFAQERELARYERKALIDEDSD
mmetsp:Transcript_115690/g.338379  ORF Transcript_115690/g.338379 Transcript_115690/m.338379 type:complete len:374 (+) Transcript_115690:134-1255(+)